MARRLTLPAPEAAPMAVGSLPKARAKWPQQSMTALAIGAFGWGVAPLIGEPGYSNPLLLGGLGVASACTATGVRAGRRRDLVDQLAVALALLQGLPRPERESVRATRWSSWWGGTPTRLTISYAPGANDGSPDWTSQIRQVLERRLLTPFRVTENGHNARLCRLTLETYIDELAPEALPGVERARAVTADLFGSQGTEVEVSLERDDVRKIAVEHSIRQKVARPAVRASIERSMTALLPGRWRARWELELDKVTFEQRPTMPTYVPHTPAPLTKENMLLIPLAVDEDGNSIVWNLGGSGPHLLIVGKTGTGKTVGINGVVMEVTRRDWRCWICDPKRIEFMGMRTWPNVELVATSVEDMVVAIKLAHDLMEERYALIEAGGDESDFEPLVLVLDEFRNFHRLVQAWYSAVKVKGMPAKCPVFDWVAAIAEKGRSGRIHLVLGTQRPDADFLTGSMRDNFDSRLALGRLSPQGAQMMWESPYLGVAVPRRIRGRGTGITEDERVEEVQVLWTPDPRRAARDAKEADLALLDALRPAVTTHPPMEVDLGDEQTLDGDPLNGWDRVIQAKLVPAGTLPPSLERAPARSQPIVGLAGAELEEAEEVNETQGLSETEQFAGYGPERPAAPGRIEVGDLIQVDETYDLWAVVEAVAADSDDLVCISWRDDEGDAGDLELSDGDHLLIRRPAAGED